MFFLLPMAMASPCSAGASSSELMQVADKAAAAFSEGLVDEQLSLRARLMGRLPCLEEAANAALVAKIQWVQVLSSFVEARMKAGGKTVDDSRTIAAMAGLFDTPAGFQFPDDLPPRHALRTFLNSAGYTMVNSEGVDLPNVGSLQVFVNGEVALRLRSKVASVIQIMSAEGEPLSTCYWWPSESLDACFPEELRERPKKDTEDWRLGHLYLRGVMGYSLGDVRRGYNIQKVMLQGADGTVAQVGFRDWRGSGVGSGFQTLLTLGYRPLRFLDLFLEGGIQVNILHIQGGMLCLDLNGSIQPSDDCGWDGGVTTQTELQGLLIPGLRLLPSATGGFQPYLLLGAEVRMFDKIDIEPHGDLRFAGATGGAVVTPVGGVGARFQPRRMPIVVTELSWTPTLPVGGRSQSGYSDGGAAALAPYFPMLETLPSWGGKLALLVGCEFGL